MSAAARPANAFERRVRRRLEETLGGLRAGRVTLEEDGARRAFGVAVAGEPDVLVRVRHPRFYRRLALRGSLGAGESYMDGDWTTDDLTGLVRLLVRRGRGEALDGPLARVVLALEAWRNRLRGNHRRGSRRNVAAHYDLGNDFFSLFLDPTLMYSCALFRDDGEDSLEAASRRKIDLVCRKLDLGPDRDVLEIGTGWGGFAEHAAARYGCRLTTTTISARQHEHARERIARAGLSDRVTVLREDYRELGPRRYDAIVSIEMIEAVGHRYLPRFLETCGRLLRPDGALLLQAILIPDAVYDRYRKGVDFIQRHVFPGGCLPSLARIQECVARRTDLRLVDLQDLTPHYAETLERWRRNFAARRDEIRALGFPESFLRAWEFYFGYCAGGFHERAIGVAQLLFSGPDGRPSLPVPRA